MSDYTPTTEEMRRRASVDPSNGWLRRDFVAEFDRWLAAHDEAIRADEQRRTFQAIVDILNAKYGGIIFEITAAEFAAARGDGEQA